MYLLRYTNLHHVPTYLSISYIYQGNINRNKRINDCKLNNNNSNNNNSKHRTATQSHKLVNNKNNDNSRNNNNNNTQP